MSKRNRLEQACEARKESVDTMEQAYGRTISSSEALESSARAMEWSGSPMEQAVAGLT